MKTRSYLLLSAPFLLVVALLVLLAVAALAGTLLFDGPLPDADGTYESYGTDESGYVDGGAPY